MTVLRHLLYLAVLAATVGYSFVANGYELFIIATVGLYALVGVGLNILLGLTGLLYFWQGQLSPRHEVELQKSLVLQVPPPTTLEIAALGFQDLVADGLWLMLVQEFGAFYEDPGAEASPEPDLAELYTDVYVSEWGPYRGTSPPEMLGDGA